jgi:hypothetical protein
VRCRIQQPVSGRHHYSEVHPGVPLVHQGVPLVHQGVLHPGVLLVRRGVHPVVLLVRQGEQPGVEQGVLPVVDRAWGWGVLPVCPGELRACRVEDRRYICLHRS